MIMESNRRGRGESCCRTVTRSGGRNLQDCEIPDYHFLPGSSIHSDFANYLVVQSSRAVRLCGFLCACPPARWPFVEKYGPHLMSASSAHSRHDTPHDLSTINTTKFTLEVYVDGEGGAPKQHGVAQFTQPLAVYKMSIVWNSDTREISRNYLGIQKHQKSQDSYRSFSHCAEHMKPLEARTDRSHACGPYAISF